tara:strand:+ start:74 stop:205 length:132 start_codon:yes stop_codon:yes gene_type:complete
VTCYTQVTQGGAIAQLDIAYTLAEREYGRGLETDLIDEIITNI